MFNMRAVVKLGQHAQQAEAADGSPTYKFDEAIVGIGVGRDHHGAAGELAVVESQKQTAPRVPFFVIVTAQCERPPIQLRDANEDAEQIAEMAERL